MKKAVLVLTAALFCAFPAFADAITVTDLAGRQVEVQAPAKRIVLTFYFEEYFAVTGREGIQNIAGWAAQYWRGRRQSTWDAFAKVFPDISKIPDVGYIPKKTLNLEAIMALKPDVVVMSLNDSASSGEDIRRLSDAGIPVVIVDYHAQSLENHTASTLLLGRITGCEKRAQELANWYRSKVEPVYAEAAQAENRPKVYMEFSGDKAGPSVYGNTWGKLMWGGIIANCGGDNIARDLVQGSDGPISREQVLVSNPDVILLAGNYRGADAKNVGLGYEADEKTAREQLEGYMSRPGWSGLNAVKNRRMGALYHDLSRHIFDAAGIQFIAKMIHPELFSDLDPLGTLKEFYSRFFPVPLTGCFMVTLDAAK